MQRTHYSALDVPSTATQPEIRAAYQRRLDDMHAGHLQGTSKREIERAYATLGSPHRRLSYDVDLAGRSLAPAARLTGSQPAVLIAGIAAGALLTAALMLVLSLPARSAHLPFAPSLAVIPTSASAALPSQPADSALAATAPDAPAPAEAVEVPTSQPAPDADAAEPPAPDAEAPAPSAAAPRPGPVTARQAPAYAPASADRVARWFEPQYSQLEAPAETDADAEAEAAPPPEPQQDVTAAAVLPAPVAIARPALSSPYGSARTSLRLPGWYCNDASGGQIFVASGAPLPDGVSC